MGRKDVRKIRTAICIIASLATVLNTVSPIVSANDASMETSVVSLSDVSEEQTYEIHFAAFDKVYDGEEYTFDILQAGESTENITTPTIWLTKTGQTDVESTDGLSVVTEFYDTDGNLMTEGTPVDVVADITLGTETVTEANGYTYERDTEDLEYKKYKIKVTVSGEGIFESTAEKEFIITKRPLKIDEFFAKRTYGDGKQYVKGGKENPYTFRWANVQGDGFVGKDIDKEYLNLIDKYKDLVGLRLKNKPGAVQPEALIEGDGEDKDAGEYGFYIWVEDTGSNNYQIIMPNGDRMRSGNIDQFGNIDNYVINQAEMESAQLNIDNWTYGAEPSEISFEFDGVLTDMYTYSESDENPVKFSVSYTGTTNAGVEYSSAEKPTEAGSYTATVVLEADDAVKNYTEKSRTVSTEFKIEKKSNLSVNYSIENKVYDGKEIQLDVTVKDTGSDAESDEDDTVLVRDNDYTVKYKVKNGEVWEDYDGVPVNAGEYKAVLLSDNYAVEKPEYEKEFTISKVAASISATNGESTTYSGKKFDFGIEVVDNLNGLYKDDYTIVYKSNMNGSEYTEALPKNADVYYAYVVVKNTSENYNKIKIISM